MEDPETCAILHLNEVNMDQYEAVFRLWSVHKSSPRAREPVTRLFFFQIFFPYDQCIAIRCYQWYRYVLLLRILFSWLLLLACLVVPTVDRLFTSSVDYILLLLKVGATYVAIMALDGRYYEAISKPVRIG